jgi:hypothetical protein
MRSKVFATSKCIKNKSEKNLFYTQDKFIKFPRYWIDDEKSD